MEVIPRKIHGALHTMTNMGSEYYIKAERSRNYPNPYYNPVYRPSEIYKRCWWTVTYVRCNFFQE